MIHITKSQRRLTIIKRGREVFSCDISLGFNPIGKKTAEGDGKTPEGNYRICSINRESKFHISFGISYPNRADALAAFHQKRISLGDLIILSTADLLRLRPKWTSPLGGYIMLHGENPEPKTGDWTSGCIAVTNDEIEKISKLVNRGERVIIEA